MRQTPDPTSPRTERALFTVLVAALLVFTACSSAATTAPTAAPVATPAAVATVAPSVAASVAATVAASMAASAAPSGKDYAALVAAAKQGFPASWEGPTAPAKAPKGIKLAGISCSATLHGCQSPVDGMRDAAKALGWQFQDYDGGGDATHQNAAILNAIAAGANVIGIVAIDPNGVQTGLAAAQKAGVLVISGSSALSEPNTYTYAAGKIQVAFDVAPDYGAMGRAEADWIINDSGGKAVALVQCDVEFPSNLAHCLPLDAELVAAGIKTYPIQHFVGASVSTTLGQTTVGFVKSHPDVTYIYSPYDPAAAFQVPALQEAGLNSIKLVSILGDAQNLGYIRAGTVQLADEAYDNEYMGYAMVDQAIRLLDKLPLSHPIGENMPYELIDSTNVPAAGSGDWHATFDYKTDFMNLWK